MMNTLDFWMKQGMIFGITSFVRSKNTQREPSEAGIENPRLLWSYGEKGYWKHIRKNNMDTKKNHLKFQGNFFFYQITNSGVYV